MKYGHSKFRLTNMKTIIAVALYVILTYVSRYAFAADPLPLICQQGKPMTNFDPKKFFSGTWYVTHDKKDTVISLCQKYKFEQESDKFVIKYGYYIGNYLYKQQCRDSKKIGEGKYSFTCTQQIGKEHKPTFNLYFTIMGTDYNRYAVFHRCALRDGELMGDDVLVLKKKEDDPTYDLEIANILKEQKLDIKTFGARRTRTCKEVTEF